ncbi:MAG TPA: hypothetical protein VJ784_22745 [Pyrinomonadaceae bacterium]|jgi:hypothetical protein|nr:hypothetical protein [Pyrinomonadaceae bacterium]
MKYQFFRKRVFLASVSSGHTSYILAEVESSRGGEERFGHYMLTIADCRRRIQLEFFLGTMRARRESLRKLDLLLNVLSSFRSKLLAEAHAITEFERADKRKSLKPQKSKKDS